MQVIDDFKTLEHVLEIYNEVIVFPLDTEGALFLDFLNYNYKMHQICCVAKLPEAGGGRRP